MTHGASLFGIPAPVNPRSGKTMSKTFAKADKVNREGAPAFSRPIEEQVLAVLMTQTMGNTFYSGKKELAEETVEVLRQAAKADVGFLAKALAYARNKGLMKMAPTVGLAVLSEDKTEAGKEAFRKVFQHVIKIPDDLREFVDLLRTGNFGGKKGIVGLRKTMIQNWLRHMSEFHGLKYGSAASEGVTLRDVLRLTHPRPKVNGEATGFVATPMGTMHVPSMHDPKVRKEGLDYERLRNGAQAELFGWLVKGWEKVGDEPSPSNPMIWAFEKLKRAEGEGEIVSLVKKYKLPWEVVVPAVKKMTTAIWRALMEGMPYMALLRNLNTLERHKVLEDKAVVKEIAKKLSDRKAVEKSKQLPFRFWNASKAYTGPQEIRDALTDALEASFVNMPEIKGTVCVSNDTSGSMGSLVSDKGEATFADIAGIFAAALFKKSTDDVMILPFDTEVYPEKGKVSRRDSLMSIAEKIQGHGGGTDVGAPIRYLIDKRIKVDVFIGITDSEDWSGRGFLSEWEEYKRKVNSDAKAFLVTIAPYRDGLSPKETKDVFYTYGWSDQILRYITMTLAGGAGQVDDVKAIDLDSFGKKREMAEAESQGVEA